MLFRSVFDDLGATLEYLRRSGLETQVRISNGAGVRSEKEGSYSGVANKEHRPNDDHDRVNYVHRPQNADVPPNISWNVLVFDANLESRAVSEVGGRKRDAWRMRT